MSNVGHMWELACTVYMIVVGMFSEQRHSNVIHFLVNEPMTHEITALRNCYSKSFVMC